MLYMKFVDVQQVLELRGFLGWGRFLGVWSRSKHVVGESGDNVAHGQSTSKTKSCNSETAPLN
jgi:hypothetical protein